MRMDKTHAGGRLRRWAIFAAALVVYFFEAWRSPNGPRGSSAIGLIFGAVGFGFMIFCGGRWVLANEFPPGDWGAQNPGCAGICG